MKLSTETVTPAMAKAWLDDKAPNRRIARSVVARYARDMASGRWRTTPHGLVFDKDGQLIDGQKRLMAVVLSDRAIEFVIARGVERELQMYVDIGQPRNLGDQMAIQYGVDSAKEKIAVANAMATRGGRAQNAGTRMTPGEMIAFIGRHEEAINFVVSRFKAKKRRGVTSAPVAAPIARAFYHVDRALLVDFVRGLMFPQEALHIEMAEPIVLLNTFLTSTLGGAIAANNRPIVYGKTERAIKAFASRERIGKLYESPVELFLLPEESAEGSPA
jgi:hypothetical protein